MKEYVCWISSAGMIEAFPYRIRATDEKSAATQCMDQYHTAIGHWRPHSVVSIRAEAGAVVQYNVACEVIRVYTAEEKK